MLRELIESDLGVTLEGDFQLPVELTDPDGNEYSTSANSPDPENPLTLGGQVLFDVEHVDQESGVSVRLTEVSLRRTSLVRVPIAGERWAVRIPTRPDATATKENFVFSPVRPPGGGASIGFIVLYLQRIAQS